MFRKILVTAAMLAAFGHAYASVDVNTANEDALRGVKGIGPAKAKAILEERAAHGPFKDPTDLGKRVKGMGGHTVERLQAEGLAVGPAGAAAGPQVAASSQNKGAAVAANTPKGGATVAVKK
ncbi:competence protein ComE [Paraburkholderia graminis]|jgi:competence protein ComEA|uniref:Competence protein ComEA n=2 Tax=Paraburkholderia graminis TaxID=60548 RepID=A0ABD5CCL0_9BURK|nr:helix-hairpin-helix domain-containing protein [Paraburkholderia graminis]AXF08796.1 competence protein ComE [Paraburkholderia graminis]MDQ0624021.1 competence protein ComEA [Paraburkholderia graminis]MDR6203022.1 competence protein ComEA [Paraburkholderia graminis]